MSARALLPAALLACLALVVADKRAEMDPMPFVLGSRYGRSSPRHISPRNDMFFMGSRYGKRSEPETVWGGGQAPGPPQLSVVRGAGPRAPPCLGPHDALYSYYRCRHDRLRPPDYRERVLQSSSRDSD